MGKKLYTLFLLFVLMYGVNYAQQQESYLETLRPGFTVDIRFFDPLDQEANSVISGNAQAVFNTETKLPKLKSEVATGLSYMLIYNALDFERELLLSDTIANTFSARFSEAYNTFSKENGKEEAFFVYTLNRKPLYDLRLNELNFTEEFKDAVKRLGRDLTPKGFISRFGTHYAEQLTYGGLYILRNKIRSRDYVNSPYDEDAFQKNLLLKIAQQQRGDSLTEPYINIGQPQVFTKGGDPAELWTERWENTVTEDNAVVINTQLVELTNLLSTNNFPETEELNYKRDLLHAAIISAQQKSISWQEKDSTANFYKKYSLQFRQKITSVIKTETGAEEKPNAYVGDLFYGAFSKNREPLKTAPIIENNGIDLNSLLTDEEVKLNRILDFTISPEELKESYVSVWDDAKKLVKGEKRTALFVSGPQDAHIPFRDALVRPIYKEVAITTIDGDVYTIKYSLEQLRNTTAILSANNNYTYSMESELVAAAARGDIETLEDLYARGASRTTSGVLEAAIQNFDNAEVLNVICDFGVRPTTADLDIVFDPDYFSKADALTLLERGASPKNNMIYKAVAFKQPEVIHALLREGAIPVNNDVAFAVKMGDYEVVKALMSMRFETFEADQQMLALAVAHGDVELTNTFINYGAEADAKTLQMATKTGDKNIIDQVKVITPGSTQVLEVAAEANDTALFDYFFKKETVTISPQIISTAIQHTNMVILEKALEGSELQNFALKEAIAFKNPAAVRLSLKKGAEPDSVFEYAILEEDFALFKEVLTQYEGDPQLAFEQAVFFDKLDYVIYVFEHNGTELEAESQLLRAVGNQNFDLVKFLVAQDANPELGIDAAVASGNFEITQFLIENGASVSNPQLIQNAIKTENTALVKLLLDTASIDPDAIMLDLIKTNNVALVQKNIALGAQLNSEFMNAALDSGNEELVLLLLASSSKEEFSEKLLFTAVQKGMPQVAEVLMDSLQNPDYALEAAFQFKNIEVLNLALVKGAKLVNTDLIRVVKDGFSKAVPVLLEKNLNPRITDNEDNGLLHFVVYKYDDGDTETLDVLIKNGVHINAKNKIGETPLHWAVKAGITNKSIIIKLLNSGALPEAQTVKRQSVADYTDDKKLRKLLKAPLAN
ncbi:ankyrin repeat domain-containing protein [Leeuwenhoekiella polynyae]|nr:ankyrin repeat domain-containing protein [Leeuwenhoekiella polynyae]